ncbi:SymE family type I addiction module toxin [Xenorhabdus szentirmaii]|uniref:SymE family type I addiction module toxin n=1 Tax=Xenorhabdus szentirmaii TaxID=290112 RepID=UPI000C05D147|nr:SymE family type I addiction module toxin [Xenorhabdus szentirmaii]PHM44391.1 endoribonuclease [Xenorhabdus szentirmaii]
MAKAHSKQNVAQNKATKTERYYTVGYVPQNDKAKAPPAIHLKGQWLKQAGFEIGDSVTVKIMDGCLVLIPTVTGPTASSSNTSASASNSVTLS